jgi:uncharacterized Zn-finger protein
MVTPMIEATPADATASVTCGFCGRSFVEDRGQPTCRGCPLAKGCHFRRCPYCGYENPVPPGWLTRLRERLR